MHKSARGTGSFTITATGGPLHQSLHDERFRFVNIAHWRSEAEFNAAVSSQGFRQAAADLRWPMNPALYQVVRVG